MKVLLILFRLEYQCLVAHCAGTLLTLLNCKIFAELLDPSDRTYTPSSCALMPSVGQSSQAGNLLKLHRLGHSALNPTLHPYSEHALCLLSFYLDALISCLRLQYTLPRHPTR